jgi:hypothetical protein
MKIPERMSHLKTWRGMAVPYGIVWDKSGAPHFAINDEHIRLRSVRNNLCSVCGTKLFRGRWLVGGPLSAFHEHGAFIDPPMHSECAHYALQVCPYLAAPHYAREVGVKKANAAAFDAQMVLVDNTMIPGRPMGDVFIALMFTGKMLVCEETYNVKPSRPYSQVEFWRHGERLPDDVGSQAVIDASPEYAKTIESMMVTT